VLPIPPSHNKGAYFYGEGKGGEWRGGRKGMGKEGEGRRLVLPMTCLHDAPVTTW